MANIYLSQKQFDLFLKILQNYVNIVYRVDKTNIEIDDTNKEYVIELISDYYMQSGMCKNYEPNKLGDEIEELLDKFI